VELDPKNSEAWLALGRAYYNQNGEKSCEAEIEPYQRCIELDPSNAHVSYMLGCCLNDVREDYEGAEKMFLKAIELDPNYAYVHTSLGNLLRDVRRDYDGAERHFRKAIELNPKRAYPYWYLSINLEKKNDIPGAIKAIEEYIRLGDPMHNGEEILARLRAKL
jgi:Flp pilus assembly protein TadD